MFLPFAYSCGTALAVTLICILVYIFLIYYIYIKVPINRIVCKNLQNQTALTEASEKLQNR